MQGNKKKIRGNELEITKFLVMNLGGVVLNHLGRVYEVGAPIKKNGYHILTSTEQVGIIKSQDARKKADIYINRTGISVKQTGGNFLYNRLQRDNILSVFNRVGIQNGENKLEQLDIDVDMFHRGLFDSRNRPWQNYFLEDDFKLLLNYLMMIGSPWFGDSRHQASYILEGPARIDSPDNLNTYTFEEYFSHYRNNIKIAIRRQWVGQSSKSEHIRAIGLARKLGNANWVYDDVVGEPNTGWKSDYLVSLRRTVYFLMIELVR